MRVAEVWSHNVVLKALCEAVARERETGGPLDFILVTGDIAFSGSAEEYALAAQFFDALSAASKVPKNRIFCVAGNHDVARDRQKLCFTGARQALATTAHVDSFLVPGEELDTLLKRQENYRNFDDSYFKGQSKTRTPEGLAYVSSVEVDDVRLAIIGLNSAWLAEGGTADLGKLLIGERQVIDALALARKIDPHIILAMAHHPLHLLQEFDRGPVQDRIEDACDLFHCGHLHQPETRQVGRLGRRCLTVAAGASFETRQSHNSYSVITLNLSSAKRAIKTVEYNIRSGAFSLAKHDEYPFEIEAYATCDLGELAAALMAYRPELSPYAHYVAALLLDAKSEFPIPASMGYTFGSFAVLETQPDSRLKGKTVAFKAFANVLRVLYGRVPIGDVLERHGGAVAEYLALLQDMSDLNADLRTRLDRQTVEAQMLAAVGQKKRGSHSGQLLSELADKHEWASLREHAARHVDSLDPGVAAYARRMLALSLSRSEDRNDRLGAIDLYRKLGEDGSAEPADMGNLAALLIDAEQFPEAQEVVLRGIRKFGAEAHAAFLEIGQRIIAATGNREFRKQLDATLASKGGRG